MSARNVVVIADDDESLRFLTAEVVRDHKASGEFDVVESDDAVKAMRAIGTAVAAGQRVLVLSDNRMPGMTGAQMLARVRAENPSAGLDLILMSSAEPPRALRDELATVGARIITRPFQLKELRAVIGGVLDAWVASG